MAGPILGVAVQRQVGEHDAHPGGERLHDRLPLAMGETKRVQQHERRPGADLAVGDPGAVAMVIQTQPHSRHPLTRPAGDRDPAVDVWPRERHHSG